jgi:hypothetical protein
LVISPKNIALLNVDDNSPSQEETLVAKEKLDPSILPSTSCTEYTEYTGTDESGTAKPTSLSATKTGNAHKEEETTTRGTYRQYEDPQAIIDKIRRYRRQRHPDSEIIKMLDNMPRRTYYNYVKKMQEQDSELMEQWMECNKGQVEEELAIFREDTCKKLRELQAIIDNEKAPTKDRLKAIEQYMQLAERLIQFNKEMPEIISRAEKIDEYSIAEKERDAIVARGEKCVPVEEVS